MWQSWSRPIGEEQGPINITLINLKEDLIQGTLDTAQFRILSVALNKNVDELAG
jgi:hypothetical protein